MSLLGNELLLCLKVAHGNIVGLDNERTLDQVMPTSKKTMCHYGHLLLLCLVLALRVIKLLAPKGDGIRLLHQHTTNSKVKSIGL